MESSQVVAGQRRGERYRPRSVSFVSWLVVVQGLGFVLVGALRIAVFGYGEQIDAGVAAAAGASPEPFLNLLLGSVWATLGICGLLSAVSLWRVRSWAWIVAMTIQGLSLLSTLAAYMRGSPNYVAMVVGVMIVFILNQQEVQETFRT